MLSHKTLLVTGATSGIGKALALSLAKANAKVILLGSREKALEETYDDIVALGKQTPMICTFNLREATVKDYENLSEVLKDKVQSLDGLIHCAGLLKALSPLEYTSLLDWHQVIQINLNAKFALTKVCLPFLKEAQRSHLIFLTSDAAFSAGKAHWGAYQVAEKGTLTMFEIYAQELKHTPIQVNMLKAPPTETKLRARAYPFEDKSSLIKPHDLENAWLRFFDESTCHGDILHAEKILQQLKEAS